MRGEQYAARSGGYPAAVRMAFEVEYQLYSYARMKRRVQAYREDCLHGTRPREEPGSRPGKGGQPGSATERIAMHLLEPGQEIREMEGWIGVIEQAWEEMKHFSPVHARVLEAVYGLLRPEARRMHESTATRYRLMEELHISQTTLYNRRNTCVEWVKAIALYKGLLCPNMKDNV